MKLSIENISDFWEILANAVELAESLWSGFQGAGDEKKEFVVDLINAKIDVPYIPEIIEGQFIGLLVDLAVELVINK